MDRLKVYMITTWPPSIGGVAKYVKELITGFNNLPESNEIELIVMADRRLKGSEELEGRHGKVKVERIWRPGWRYSIDIIRYLFRKQVNIVHIQHEYLLYGGYITSILFPVMLFLLRILRRGKILVHMHSVAPKSLLDFNFFRTNRITRQRILAPLIRSGVFIVTSLICQLSHAIIVHAAYLKRTLIQDYSVKPEKIYVIRHPLSSPEQNPNSYFKGENGAHEILFHGYLSGRKGVDQLLRAFSDLAKERGDIHLTIAGGNSPNFKFDFLGEMKQLTHQLGIQDCVLFTGYIEPKELNSIFKNADVLVLPYKDSIAASGVISQASQYCLPIIASDLGVLKEEIEEGKIGLLFKAGSVEELKKALLLILQDGNLRHKLRENFFNYAKERSWENATISFLHIYRKITTD
jgi:glycosyltransferase involved in cell wall biosynthesis